MVSFANHMVIILYVPGSQGLVVLSNIFTFVFQTGCGPNALWCAATWPPGITSYWRESGRRVVVATCGGSMRWWQGRHQILNMVDIEHLRGAGISSLSLKKCFLH